MFSIGTIRRMNAKDALELSRRASSTSTSILTLRQKIDDAIRAAAEKGKSSVSFRFYNTGVRTNRDDKAFIKTQLEADGFTIGVVSDGMKIGWH